MVQADSGADAQTEKSPEFGHFAENVAGFHLDTWGAGDFEITIDGKAYRFEDSDRFGPALVKKNGDLRDNPCPPENSPFWRAHAIWRRQGRRLADDGVTCIWDEPKPQIIQHLGGKHFLIVDAGEEDGKIIKLPAKRFVDFSDEPKSEDSA